MKENNKTLPKFCFPLLAITLLLSFLYPVMSLSKQKLYELL